MTDTIGKVALLWRGDRDATSVRNTRLEPVLMRWPHAGSKPKPRCTPMTR
jgi:hypothetical protein